MNFICSTTTNVPYTFEEPSVIVLPSESPISDKNSYRHLRQMYHIWKNYSLFNYPSEIAICQERRHLFDTHIPKGYDIVLPARTHKSNKTSLSVYEQWLSCLTCKNHKLEYFNTLLEIVPGMQGYSMIRNNPYARYHNMGVYTYPVFEQMCFFLFTTLDILEDRLGVDPTGDNYCYAFLGERIADYWYYTHQELKVYESPIVEYPKVL